MKPCQRTGLYFALPAAACYLPLLILPLAYSVILSLHVWNGMAADWTFTGLENYQRMLADDVFWKALTHNVVLLLCSLFIQLPMALGLALLLTKGTRVNAFLRTCVFLPYILPTVVIALVWKMLFSAATPVLLGSNQWSMPAVILVITWRFVGFHMILYIAGLAAIPRELYDAAHMDGADGWDRFRHVTLPQLRPVIAISAVLAVVGSLKYFDIVYVMTRGGPDDSTQLLATYMVYQTLEAGSYGYASALAMTLVVLAAAGMAAVMGVVAIWRKRP